MVSLKHWMADASLSDAEMAERIGDISAEGVRKLRFGARGPSSRVSAAIFAITAGAVRPPDLVPARRNRTSSTEREVRAG